MTLTGRVGRFFLFTGFVLLAIFFASDLAGDPRYNLFFIALILTVVGILMMRRGHLPPEPSGRFRLLRMLRPGKKKKGREEPQAERGGSSEA